MITNLNLLRNIGQFDSVSSGGQIALNKFTIFYAENGRGKTTLAAILRSLGTGNTGLILERHRLGAQHPAEIVISATGGTSQHRFHNGAWTSLLPSIAVFDDTFVDQNVCSGLEVMSDQLENLHELILGAQGVALSRAFQDHVTKIEDHNRELRLRESAIPVGVRNGLSIDAFCALPSIPNVAQDIEEVNRNLAAANSSEEIRTKPLFAEFAIPKFDVAAIDGLLRLDLPGLEASAVEQVKKHLSKLGQNAEIWVSEGVKKIQPSTDPLQPGEICPFCTQDLSGSTIIEHYRAYFGKAYEDLKATIDRQIQTINRAHSEDAPSIFERAISAARLNQKFWADFVPIPEITIDTTSVARAWKNARDSVRNALREKQASPLERLELSDATLEAIRAYHLTCDTVTEVSSELQLTNAQISIVKERTAAANIAALKSDLVRLQMIETRHSASIDVLCQDYLTEKSQKAVTERLRDTARAQLDQYRQTVFPSYEAAINTYLGRFNAGFRLGSVTSVNHRGGTSLDYHLLINNSTVPLGGGAGQPAFRNTLSAGDRNTLALAFFFASLDQDPNISQKIVIIDDPMTSLDDHRSLTTVQEMGRLTNRVSQVIVLSHSKPFLLGLWDGADRTNRVALKFSRIAAGSTLQSWNASADCITEHDRRHALVLHYINQGTQSVNEREVAMALRPMLESFTRVAYPEDFPPGSLLGPFLHHCRQRLGGTNQILSGTDITELQNILDYANKFHHDTNSAYLTEAINDQELLDFSKRTIQFIRRN